MKDHFKVPPRTKKTVSAALTNLLYATDASVYKEVPDSVAVPTNVTELKSILQHCREQGKSLIPRAGGTSLAGQVVGSGVVVDISKHFTKVLEVNTEHNWVRVQPGINLDELNAALKPHKLFFGPETSTSNRCRLGGMVGNNSCGSHSIIYGSTRDHLLEVKALLADGSEAVFGELSPSQYAEKLQLQNLEGELYRNIHEILSDPKNQQRIRTEYPDPKINRRNNGYAIDVLLESEPFTKGGKNFNFCKLLAGSEGTLAFITELKLNCVPLPDKLDAVLCIHVDSLEKAFETNLIALKYSPSAVELIDHYILDCTKTNISQAKNRFFLEGEPAALLVAELNCEDKEEVIAKRDALMAELQAADLAYACPILYGADIGKVWQLRKAGLGLLSNIPGDKKPVAVIEDTAVTVEALPAFMAEFRETLAKHSMECVFYAHIGSGEIHLRPILNLKNPADIALFRTILHEVAVLTKKYKGSLCGEHGTGRLRGEFLPYMIGKENYALLQSIKKTWDPQGLFNPGKVVDTPSMTDKLRFENHKEDDFQPFFDFSDTHGYIKSLEKCNGSGDCRKSSKIGGAMCPSFQASGDEFLSTRGRANLLRELHYQGNAFRNKELYKIINYCLSCKACKSECPSNVDMTKIKAEFLHQYHQQNGVPLRTRLIAHVNSFNTWMHRLQGLGGWLFSMNWVQKLLLNSMGFAPERKLPQLSKHSLQQLAERLLPSLNPKQPKKKLFFFIDEFSNYYDTVIGEKALKLLTKMGYHLELLPLKESGRSFLSKGLLKQARRLADYNTKICFSRFDADFILVGLEPSAVLSYRDEYPELVSQPLRSQAKAVASRVLLVDEFLSQELENGNIDRNLFSSEKKEILFHTHCHQKALAKSESVKNMLSIPKSYHVTEIDSGCCGMAGSFGYEKEHYALSQQIGELKLFPAVRKNKHAHAIVASGTSCRHQIAESTDTQALHPVELLYEAIFRG